MPKRTKRMASLFPRIEHARRERCKKHQRYLAIRMKNAPVPTTPLFAAKAACHAVLDRLWCGPNAPLNRKETYKYLRKITKLGVDEAHVARFSIALCEHVIVRIRKDYPHLFTDIPQQHHEQTHPTHSRETHPGSTPQGEALAD